MFLERQELRASFGEWYSKKNAIAVTFTTNRSVPYAVLRDYLKKFSARVDERRLGGRYYQAPLESRLDFLLVPEHLNAGNSHLHGFLVPPEDDLQQWGLDRLEAEYDAVWGAICPGGSIHFEPLGDPAGWAAYCSKENDLIGSDKAIWSLSDLVSARATSAQ